MSTIRVDNFGPSAGGTPYSARGIAKAWVNVASNTTPATLGGSENIASLTDNSTGNFTVTFSNVMADTAYTAVLGAGGGTVSSNVVPTTKETGSQNIVNVNSSYVATDGSHSNCALFGDLA